VVGSNFTVNAAGGDRHSNSIMTNVLYDFTPGYPITPHVGFGVGAADVFDGLKLPGIGQVLKPRVRQEIVGAGWRDVPECHDGVNERGW